MKPLKIFSLRRNSEISSFSKVYPFSKISNTKIDDFTYISFRCTINGCQIGKFCSIASGVKIGLGNHPTDFVSSSPFFYSPSNPLGYNITDTLSFKENETVHIGHDVWIGTNAVIMDGITIGNGAIIGANSVVTKDVEPYTIVGGVPAKEIRKRFSTTIVDTLIALEWWNMPLDFLKQKKIKHIFSKQLDTTSLERLKVAIETYNLSQ